MKTLIIVRHGNTFLPEQTPTRVGGRTDLPLVEEKKGRAIGKYLLTNNIIPDKIHAAPLKRTIGTAQLIVEEANLNQEIIIDNDFREIDYGPDENKTEDEVMLRLGKAYLQDNNLSSDISDDEIMQYGKQAIKLWDSEAIVPNGWKVDIEQIIESWRKFSDNISEGETVLLCTSNGIIRFAPHLLHEGYNTFSQRNGGIKVSTGSVSIFECKDGIWTCKTWNIKP